MFSAAFLASAALIFSAAFNSAAVGSAGFSSLTSFSAVAFSASLLAFFNYSANRIIFESFAKYTVAFLTEFLKPEKRPNLAGFLS